jgi:hypothetical protein
MVLLKVLGAPMVLTLHSRRAVAQVRALWIFTR